MIGATEIAALIPHAGAMSLLAEVTSWNETAIACRASSHRDPANPLRAAGRLGIMCGIEYAAQAMAMHGGLTAIAAAAPRQGFLASLREVACHAERLDDIEADLAIEARQLLTEGGRVLYQFSITGGDRLLLAGRAAVVLA